MKSKVKVLHQKLNRNMKILFGFDMLFRFSLYIASAAILSLFVFGFTFFAAPASAFLAFYCVLSVFSTLAVLDFAVRPFIFKQSVDAVQQVADMRLEHFDTLVAHPREKVDTATQTQGCKNFFDRVPLYKRAEKDPVLTSIVCP